MSKCNKTEFCLPTVVSCLLVMLGLGILYLWSLFQQPVMNYYGWDLSSVTMVPSVMLCCYTAGTFLGGILQDNTSPRVGATLGGILFTAGIVSASFVDKNHPTLLYVTYGGLAGAGVGFGYAAALNCIQKWFPTNRGFGVGLAVASFGISTAIFAPLVNMLLELPRFGDHAVPFTFRVLGILFGGIVLLSGQFLKNPGPDFQKNGQASNSSMQRRQYTFGEAVKCQEFWIVCTCMFCSMASYLMLNPIIKTLGITREMSEFQINLTISVTGISSALSRLGCPVLSEYIGKTKAMLLLLLINISSMLMLTTANGIFYAVAVQMAVVAYGGPSGICATMITDSFGTRYSGTIHGVTIIFFGLSSFVFPKLSTILYDCTNSYTMAFIIGALACVPAIYAVLRYDKLRKKRMAAETR